MVRNTCPACWSTRKAASLICRSWPRTVSRSKIRPKDTSNSRTRPTAVFVQSLSRNSCLQIGEELTVMAAHAGETAQETGDFHCHSCGAVVHVTKGKKIPECPHGHKTFDTRTGEPGNKSR